MTAACSAIRRLRELPPASPLDAAQERRCGMSTEQQEDFGWNPDDAETLQGLDDQEIDNLSRNGSVPAASVDLDVLTAKEICELPDPPEEDRLIEDLFVRGARTVTGGGTGEGKTSLMLQALKTLLLGGEFLGITVRPVKGRVLVVDAEQGTRSIKRLLRDA